MRHKFTPRAEGLPYRIVPQGTTSGIPTADVGGAIVIVDDPNAGMVMPDNPDDVFAPDPSGMPSDPTDVFAPPTDTSQPPGSISVPNISAPQQQAIAPDVTPF